MFFIYSESEFCMQMPPEPASTSSAPSTDDSMMVKMLREKVARLEQQMQATHAGVAIMKKKGEKAAAAAQYAERELRTATETLWCKFPNLFLYPSDTSC